MVTFCWEKKIIRSILTMTNNEKKLFSSHLNPAIVCYLFSACVSASFTLSYIFLFCFLLLLLIWQDFFYDFLFVSSVHSCRLWHSFLVPTSGYNVTVLFCHSVLFSRIIQKHYSWWVLNKNALKSRCRVIKKMWKTKRKEKNRETRKNSQ